MKHTVSRVLWAIIGILLIIAGCICLGNPDIALSTISVFLGVVVLLSGIVDVVIFAKGNRFLFGAGWFLVDGILSIILSLFILLNQVFTALTLPFILGMWLIFSGLSRFVHSFELRNFGVRGWCWMTATGLLMTVVGFISFMNPVAGIIAVTTLCGILLVFQGSGFIINALFSGRFMRP